MVHLTTEKVKELIASIHEMQAQQKVKPTIMLYLEDQGLTDYQAKIVYKKAIDAWADSEDQHSKERYKASLARMMGKAEKVGQFNAAIKALELIGKVDGMFEETINIKKTKTFDELRLEELLREINKNGG